MTENDVLLVVDVQNDFYSNGALAVPGGEEIVPAVNRLAQRFRHVVLTQAWHPPGHHSFASTHPGRRPHETIMLPCGSQTPWPDHCVQGTEGAQFHADLKIVHAELIPRKGCRREIDSYSAFFENDHTTPTGLAGYLRERGLGRVFLAGLAFDFCVRYSAEDAHQQGFDAAIVERACRSIDVASSLAETHRRFAHLAIPSIAVSEVA